MEEIRQILLISEIVYKTMMIIATLLGIKAIISLIEYIIEKQKENKKIRYGIFMMDGFCFLRQAMGGFLMKAMVYVYIILLDERLKQLSVIKFILKYSLLSAVLYFFSLLIEKYTASIYEYYTFNNKKGW